MCVFFCVCVNTGIVVAGLPRVPTYYSDGELESTYSTKKTAKRVIPPKKVRFAV